MKVVKNQQGLTLVELVVGMTISTIILAAIVGVLSTSVRSHQYNFQEESNIQDARAVLNEVSDQLRYATSISSPPPGGSANTITYRLHDDANDRRITQGTDADQGYVLFRDAAGNVRKIGAGRIASINFAADYAPKGSSPPSKRTVVVGLQAISAGTTPESVLTTSIVTFNAF